jgi:hypothetical protein
VSGLAIEAPFVVTTGLWLPAADPMTRVVRLVPAIMATGRAIPVFGRLDKALAAPARSGAS